jgi:EAL domain-containing protein (putative c-di-GMP-specific phosphodiesterase class I)/GGDEF domain-containing protein
MDDDSQQWQGADLPLNEAERITELYELQLLDTPTDPNFDRLTALAADIVGGHCLVSLVDSDRQWFKSSTCHAMTQTPRHMSFCAFLVAEPQRTSLVVNDTVHDDTFQHNPLVTAAENPIRSYAGVPLHGPKGALLGTVCMFRSTQKDFTEQDVHVLHCIAKQAEQAIAQRYQAQQQAEKDIQHQLFDHQTQLPNYEYFIAKLDSIQTSQQHDGHVVAINIQRYHYMHSVYSTDLMHCLLMIIIQRLQVVLPKSAVLARHSEDMFLLFVPAQQIAIEDMLLLIRDSFEDAVHFDNKAIFTSVKLGVSTPLAPQITAQEVTTQAIDTCEQSHHQTIAHFQSEHMQNQWAQKAIEIEHELHMAIKQNAFTLVYQPIVESYSEAVIGVEALVRWRWKPNEYLSPAEFIPIAEDAGLILPLSQWILKTACVEFAAMQRVIGYPLFLSVNISASELRNEDIINDIKHCLNTANMESAQLQLEITEHTLMGDLAVSRKILNRLQRMGVRIALDDFGTGHSSLQYLQELPIDAIKIDRSFIHKLNPSQSPSPVLKAIIAVGHELGISLTAEGIETQAQAEFIKQQHISCGQGYYFSKPKCIGDVMEELGQLTC